VTRQEITGLMSKEPDVQHLERTLLDKRDELLDITHISIDSSSIVTLDQSRVGRLSRMDAMQAQALSVAADGRRKLELERIRCALDRIDEGDYGYCEQCGEGIARARLEIDPAAEYCINCAGAIEAGSSKT
jgi:DnaK suppressor protein